MELPLQPDPQLDEIFRIWQPPPNLSVGSWADTFLQLSPEDSAEPGKFHISRAPYQRAMMDAVSDPMNHDIIFCTSSQIGKSLIAKAIFGYFVHQDPGPILIMQPTVSMAETFSKDRIAPMVRDTPVLTTLVADAKTRTASNTILKKVFPGGTASLVGANSPTDLAGRPIRIVFADEVDRYPPSAGTEGDPIFLARQRIKTFHNRKFIMASTPTVEGRSRIWQAFEKSDMRYYWVPCPHCGEFHVLKWSQMVWDENDPSSARMVCPICQESYTESSKQRMLEQGEWRPSREEPGIAGFHISALYSPWETFPALVKEFLYKKGHSKSFQTFINLQLGECWEDRTAAKVDHMALSERKEPWDSTGIPDDIVLITYGVDVQDDRLEYSAIGWTSSEQARVIEHAKIWGAPGERTVWEELDARLTTPYLTLTGRSLRVRAVAIDTGGHHAQRVYEFCRPRLARNVYAIKGRAGNHPIWPSRSGKSKTHKGAQFYSVGVDSAKDAVYSALAVGNSERPRYVAFSATLDDQYFQQLTAEKRVVRPNAYGVPTSKWVVAEGVRNEAFDAFVYALAALEALKQSGVRLCAVGARMAKTIKQPAPTLEAMPKPMPMLPEPPPPQTVLSRAEVPARRPRIRQSSAVL